MKHYSLSLFISNQSILFKTIISSVIIGVFFYILYLILNRWFLRKENQGKNTNLGRIEDVGVLSIHEIKTLIKDDESLNEIVNIIRANFEKKDFKVPFLARRVCKARVTLYREIKKKTGRTAITFIKLVRLLEADELLKNTNLSITSISYQVGFKAPSYFSTTYKKEFGCSPGEVRNKIVT